MRIVLLLALVVVAPTARSLDRRLALNGGILLGWLPLVAWLPAALLPVDRAVLALAFAWSGTAGLLVGRGRRWGVSAVPVSRPRDLAIFATALGGTAAAWPLIRVPSGPAALGMLFEGWDQASHFGMYLNQRVLMAAPPFQPGLGTDGTAVEFRAYPQWYHSLLSTVADICWGPLAATPDEELRRYALLQGVLFVVLGVVVMCALLQSLPDRASGPALSVAIVCTLSFLGVPGVQTLRLGHLTFLLAVTAVILVVTLTDRGQRPSPGTTIAIIGLLVTSVSWLLIAPLAVVAAAPYLREALRSGHAVATAVVGVLACLPMAQLLTVVPSGAGAVNLPGDTTRQYPLVVAATAVVALGLALLGLRQTNGSWSDVHDTYSRLGQLAALASAELGALATYQLLTAGALEYYWWKLALGCQAVLLVTMASRACRLASMPGRHLPRARSVSMSRLLLVVGACALILGLGVTTQGNPAPSIAWLTTLPEALDRGAEASQPTARAIVAYSREPDVRAARTTMLLPDAADPTGVKGNQWFHALTVTRTAGTARLNDLLVTSDGEYEDKGTAVLMAAPDTALVTADEIARRLVSAHPELASRVHVVGSP